jgi:hypothetical protein
MMRGILDDAHLHRAAVALPQPGPIAHNPEQSGHCRVGAGWGPLQWTIVGR